MEKKTLEQLKAQLVELNETAKAIVAKAHAENRALSAEEQRERGLVCQERDQVQADIARRERRVEASDTYYRPKELRAPQLRRVAGQGHVAASSLEKARERQRRIGERLAEVTDDVANSHRPCDIGKVGR